MSQSSGANAHIAYIAETVYGTTPATPELTGLPVTSFALNLTKQNTKDTSVQIDGQTRYTSFGNTEVTGDIEDVLSTLHDPFLEATMRSTFATSTLKMANTEKSFTFEQGFPSTSLYRSFTGVLVDKMAITVPVNGDVTVKYSCIGKAMTLASATIDTSAGITVPAVKKSMKHNGGSVTEGGSSIAYITNINLNVDNALTPNFVLGSSTIRDATAGIRKISGTFTALFESNALMNKFIAGTTTSFGFTVSDGTNTYNFLMSNVSYTAAALTVTNAATIPVQVTFEADYDPTALSSLVITKT